MASNAQKEELIEKVSTLVSRRFHGNYRQAFTHYASSHSATPTVDERELKSLLADAGIGNSITRGMWASGIIDELDKDADRRISWTEFEAVIRAK